MKKAERYIDEQFSQVKPTSASLRFTIGAVIAESFDVSNRQPALGRKPNRDGYLAFTGVNVHNPGFIS